MPFVNVYYPEGQLNEAELSKVSMEIHRSLMQHFKVPEDDYFEMFLPYSPNQFFYNPHYLLEGGDTRTDKVIHVSITCGPGRTIQQKKDLYQSISQSVNQDVNIPTTDVFITLNETPLENWSFGQGIAQV